MMMNYDERQRTIAMLRYQAERYQAMGKGSISQQLNAKIRRLMNEKGNVAVQH
ncbi:MAG: hypothetical protein LUE98_01335 [Tannerellaceae bacterium]|nr:hypothetical protein [Tannerellaceae bacterium]MCD8042607.1 hypothetical protein [Tannerellaceae bacterium]MCD8176128.1 hypothetical protein [Tannerellaceae bacterium]